MPLTNWQDFISKKFPGAGAQPTDTQLAELAQQFFGNIPLPPGIDESQVVSRTGAEVQYKDQDGYVHSITRILDGRSPNVGQIVEGGTNRPAVPPSTPQEKGQINDLEQLAFNRFKDQFNTNPNEMNTGVNPFISRLNEVLDRLQAAPSLAQIDPATAANLAAIKAAEQGQLNQQFQEGQGNLIAKLFGTGVNRSSIAGDQAAHLLQYQGLVQAQEQANAAQRELAIRQFLTQQGQGNLALATQGITQGGDLALQDFAQRNNISLNQAKAMLEYLGNLQNQGLQRDVAGGQLDLANRQFAAQQKQYQQAAQQAYIQWQEQQRMLERQNTWNNLFRGVGLAASIATGIPGLFGQANSGGSNQGPGGGAPSYVPPSYPSPYQVPPLTGYPGSGF